MAVGFADRITWAVDVLVMWIVTVPMLVLQDIMFVLVLMCFG